MSIDRRNISRIVKDLRTAGTDTQNVEVKESAQKLPSSIVETISAFANTSGGVVILGLSEVNGFRPVEGFRAKAIADALATASSDKLTPPVRLEIEIVQFEDAQLVVARVPELIARDKPCYITARGVYHGSYTRVSDGDRMLSSYEVDRLLENRAQPSFDIEPVDQASLSDLDQSLVQGVLARQRLIHPRIFASMSDEDALVSLHVVARNDVGNLVPTLAGLLALGTYPQRYFPRLTVSFTAYGNPGDNDPAIKYLDAQTMAGPIPALVEDTLSAVRRNMRVGGVLDSESHLRKEMPDFPLPAVREAVANALMHRDYSPLSRGTSVQVGLYDDRLEIINPGGLYGTVTVNDLGQAGYSSTRNQFLSSLLESVPFQGGFLVENRGTGYRLIQQELARHGMPEPEPKDSIAAFSLTMRKAQEKQQAQPVRRANGVLAFLGSVNEASAAEISAATGMPRSTVAYQLGKLVNQGAVERIGELRSPKQRYRIAKRRDE